MLASQIQKERLTPEEINLIISSSGFTSITSLLESILRKSRDRKISSINLLKLQGKIAEKMIIFEKQIEIFKESANRENQNDEWRSREIYKAQRNLLKQVMDGIAFRFLNFERPVLRQLAQHNQTGHLTKGFVEEIKKAEYIVNETGFFVILNDLTNFLRYGDLTIISPKGYLIDEVKTTGTSKGNQRKALDHLIHSLNKKVLEAYRQSAQYVTISGKPTNFLSQVERLIDKSKRCDGGIYAERLAPYLWVSSLYFPKLMEYYKSHNNMPNLPKSPFLIKDIFPPTNSLMFFDEFSPNTMPYSAFPFDERVICEIMTGQVQLKAVVSEKELIKTFGGKGWKLTMPSKADIVSIYDTDDIDKIKEAVNNPKYHCTLKKGEFNFKLPREMLLRIQTEFRSAKAIIDEAEGLMRASADRKTRMVTTNMSEEYQIWN